MKKMSLVCLTIAGIKIDLTLRLASKDIVEVDFGYFSVEIFGENDWTINFRYLRLKYV